MAIRRADKYTVNSKLQTKFADFMGTFEINPATRDLIRNVNDAAIRESLKNLLLTDLGERPFQPTIGSDIRRNMFGVVDDITTHHFRTAIQTTIQNHEPRVVLRDLSIIPDDEHNLVSITVFYSTINSPGQPQELTIDILTRVR